MSWQLTIDPLSQLNIQLGEGCSLSCRPCRWQNQPEGQPPGWRLTRALITQAVSEALPLGLRIVRLTGRGVLLYPELDALLDWMEDLNLAIAIEVDGQSLASSTAQRLARLPQASAWVGLDGASAAIHESVSGREGSFEAATRAIRLLAETGLPAQVVVTVRRANAAALPEIIRLVEELGGDSILFSMLHPGQPGAEWQPEPGSNGSQPDGELEVAELIALGWRIERELTGLTRLKLAFDLPPVFRGLHPKTTTGSLGSPHSGLRHRCGILSALSLTAAGEYALCGLSDGRPDFALGRLGSDSLELVWTRHPFLQLLRQGMPHRLEGVCRSCTVKSVCLGFCAVENYLQSGSFWSANWFCENAARAGLFPAGRLVENTW